MFTSEEINRLRKEFNIPQPEQAALQPAANQVPLQSAQNTEASARQEEDWLAALRNYMPDDLKNPVKESVTVKDQTGINVNTDFLVQVEGFKTNGYVPMESGKALQNSGVTIASGLDLGAQSEERLRLMGMEDNLINKFKPYLGIKKDAAVALIRKQPLTLTREEALKVNAIVKPFYARDIAAKFNSATKGPKFEELPSEWQTAIASVGFQYGTNLAKATPNFWRQVTTGDWKGAHANLNNFGDKYPTRRKKEANLVSARLDWNAPKAQPEKIYQDDKGRAFRLVDGRLVPYGQDT